VNPFERLVAPFNNRAVSASGAGIITAAATRLYHDVGDAGWMTGLVRAIFSHSVLTDRTTLYELDSLAACFVLGCICLYVGAPWFIRKT
jgi:hypothetical protein